jgi:hypothetical protein
MDRSLLRQGRFGDDGGGDFHQVEASEQHDMPSPGVGEDIRLRFFICKPQEKYGACFL